MVAVACVSVADAGDTLRCEIVKSECVSVSNERETELRTWCDAAPNCVETSRRIFVIREVTAPRTPPPAVGSGKV